MITSISVDIEAPPAQVFHWLDDSERIMQWVEGVTENEELTTTEGKVGSTFRQVFVEKGRPMEFAGVVTGYEENRRVAIQMDTKGFGLDVEYVLEPQGGGTRLTQNSSVRWHGLFRLLGPVMVLFMKKSGERKVQADFARLKALCEGAGEGAGAGGA